MPRVSHNQSQLPTEEEGIMGKEAEQGILLDLAGEPKATSYPMTQITQESGQGEGSEVTLAAQVITGGGRPIITRRN